MAKSSWSSSSTPEGTTQDHAKFHQGRHSTCNTEESDIQAASEGRCNCQESDGGVTPLELALGRRPADLIQLDVATPTQLTIDRNEEELTAIQIKQLSKQAFQEAR